MKPENALDLAQLQREHRPWSERNFGACPSWYALLGIFEEAGELAHAHLKGVQGIRGTPEEHRAAKIDAVGDLVTFLAAYCNAEGLDLQAAVETTWDKVKARDYKNNPMNPTQA